MSAADHIRLLDSSVEPFAAIARRLDGCSVLVTGASGFLASSLLVYLDALRRTHGIQLHLRASARRAPDKVPLFAWMGCQPWDQWELAGVEHTTVPAGPRWILVHTASYGAPADYMAHPVETYQANVDGLRQLFAGAAGADCTRIIYFSSAEVYGQPPEKCIPTPESYTGGPDLADPRSIYGESKRMAEVLGLTMAAASGIDFTILRPWNVYGPGQRISDGRVPVAFFRQHAADGLIHLLSDGSPRRSFCHVWEAMPQIAACLTHQDAAGRAFNIGRQGDEISILELARACARACSASESSVIWNPSAQAPGMARCQPETSRVHSLLESTPPAVPLADGLLTMHQWVRHLTDSAA
jgi:nucleoside-diphosphate-sugar epimerase